MRWKGNCTLAGRFASEMTFGVTDFRKLLSKRETCGQPFYRGRMRWTLLVACLLTAMGLSAKAELADYRGHVAILDEQYELSRTGLL
jgi:hypothetical protein